MLSSTRYSPAADVVCNASILATIIIGFLLSPIWMVYAVDVVARDARKRWRRL